MMKRCIAIVLGTRPEAIKLLPVIERLSSASWCRLELVASGQQGPLLRQALAATAWRDLDIPAVPPHAPDATSRLGLLADQLRPRLASLRPDVVVVHGDTATAMAGAQVAQALGLRIAHVEAGLRTYDLAHPYPEEAYRQAIARLGWLHFAPTQASADNLVREGVPAGQVVVTGNTIVDTLLRDGLPADAAFRGDGACQLAIVTLHRQELEPQLGGVVEGLLGALSDHADLQLRIPTHPNLAVTRSLQRALAGQERVHWFEPLPHAGFLALLRRADVVITDSGGVQEEASVLGIPMVVVRKATERPEVMAGGRARLTGFDAQALRGAVTWALQLGPFQGMSGWLGDGQAAVRIAQTLSQALALSDPEPQAAAGRSRS